jgi:hypothetical protein
VSVARFVADQRTFYGVPYAVCCAIIGVSVSWLYKWLDRPVSARQRRRAGLDAEVLKMFQASQRTYGSPRIHAPARGWLDGRGEHRRGLDAPSGSAGPQTQAQQARHRHGSARTRPSGRRLQ